TMFAMPRLLHEAVHSKCTAIRLKSKPEPGPQRHRLHQLSGLRQKPLRLEAGMKVLVYFNWPVQFWNVPESHVEILRRRFPDVTFTHTVAEDEAIRAAQD